MASDPRSPIGGPGAPEGRRGDPLSGPALWRRLPSDACEVSLLGVDYVHVKTREGGDLYVTRLARKFWEHLLPENWHAADWFEANRQRLVGTSTVYRVPTRCVRGFCLDLVVKWSRVGEEVPADTITINKFINAEFNSPFEEFSLLMELRRGEYGPPGIRIRAQIPLGIYVPSARLQLWQTGRSEEKIAAKLARHPGVELDILRQYVLIFGWINGRDAVETAEVLQLRGPDRERFLTRTTSLVTHELERKGFRVIDMKPAHIIVRTRPDGVLLRDRHGQVIYAVVDYELMERTPEHEHDVRQLNRRNYLQHVARRFETPSDKPLPPHLKSARLLGVDYITGHAESTGGLIWVVGNDPDLFNYFLPERWRRTPKTKLSATHDVYRTRTKDDIELVWRISRLGDLPARPGPEGHDSAAVDFGYNSPFEEFARALELARAGLKTVNPRAIYMTGPETGVAGPAPDPRRYQALASLRTPDSQPAVCPDHDYITIWGFWNGPDEWLARQDGQFFQSIDAGLACQRHLISTSLLAELIHNTQCRLADQGFEDLNLKADHLLFSVGPNGKLVLDSQGQPEVRLCNFELVRQRPAN